MHNISSVIKCNDCFIHCYILIKTQIFPLFSVFSYYLDKYFDRIFHTKYFQTFEKNCLTSGSLLSDYHFA